MENGNESIVVELMEKVNISFEEAKDALEKNKWDILDAVVFLEASGVILGSGKGDFYTNISYENTAITINLSKNESNKEFKKSKKEKDNNNKFWEWICNVMDIGNTTWLNFSKNEKELFTMPLIVLVLLTFFMVGTVIPAVIVAMFFDIRIKVSSEKLNIVEVNKVLNSIHEGIEDVKEKVKKEFRKND